MSDSLLPVRGKGGRRSYHTVYSLKDKENVQKKIQPFSLLYAVTIRWLGLARHNYTLS